MCRGVIESCARWMLVVCALAAHVACARTADGVDDTAPVAPAEYHSSGRVISGVFALRKPPGDITMTFTADGSWTRVDGAGPSARTTGGSYLIDDQGHLVSYLERIGDARLSTADEAVFEISGDLASGFTLEDGAGRVSAYERIGDEPPRAPAP